MLEEKEFNLKDFLDICIPAFLQNRNDYYIKGGKAHDVYFKNITYSVDYDLVGTTSFKEYIESMLEGIEKKIKLKLLKRQTQFDGKYMFQYGFENFFIEEKDPYLIDLLIDINFKENDFTTLCGINYMTINNFMKDLLITKKNRYILTQKYKKSLDTTKFYKDFNKFKKKYNFELNFEQTIEMENINQLLKSSLDFIKNNLTNITNSISDEQTCKFVDDINNDLVKKLTESLNHSLSLYDIVRIINNIDHLDLLEASKITVSKQTKKKIREIDTFLEEFNDILSEYNAINNTKIENISINKKYDKTMKRYKNIISINWNQLSDVYKIYILSNCYKKYDKNKHTDTIELYDISDTCKAYILCHNGISIEIKTNTKDCD